MHNGLRHIILKISSCCTEDGTCIQQLLLELLGAPELETQMFVDWALTKDAQEIGQHLVHTNSQLIRCKVPEQAKPLADVKLNPYDLEWSGENRAQLVEKWDNMIKDTKKEQ